MSNLVPLVTPPNNTQGIPVGYVPTAIFEKSIEPGSINTSTCFIVEIPTHNQVDLDAYIANSSFGDIVQSRVTYERINLLDEDPSSVLDFGGDVDSGEKYRTKIYIKPINLLKPNTTYAVMLSKDISLLSVFDVEANSGNSGTGGLNAQGPFLGLVQDTYTITIAASGNKNTAKYIWNRASDNKTSVMIEARGRLIEIDKGLKIEFKDGTYAIGDSFTVKVIPQDKQSEIFSWTFSTSSGDYKTPTDEKSGTLLNLPVIGDSTVSGDGMYVTNIKPSNTESMLKIPRKANVGVGDVAISTKDYTSSFNGYTVQVVDGATAGAEVISLVGSDIVITIEDGESTAQQVVDAFNASALVNSNFEATLLGLATAKQTVKAKTKLSKGVDKTVITVTFNKDISPASISDKIKLTTRPIYPSGPSEELTFSTAVSGKQLIITLEEQE